MRDERRGRRIAVVTSLALHAALCLLAWRSFDSRFRNPNGEVPVEVSFEAPVASAAPPPTPTPTDEPRAPGVARPAEHQRLRAPVQRAEPEMAQPGGETNAPVSASTLPVDLTSETLVAISSNPSGGGTRGSGGSGSGVGRTSGAATSTGSVGGEGASDRSGGVSLANQNWSCPWPREADAERIDDLTVSIRVVVDEEGVVESVIVLADPGHGFGQAAVACARRTRFTPARDREGRPVGATSPPILVRFTR
jgi:periplasmic protein TonB